MPEVVRRPQVLGDARLLHQNDLDHALWWFRGRLVAGASVYREHPVPTTIDEWARFVPFSVLGYEAYFRAFYESDEQLVGDGVDVAAVRWPSS
jgi:hypothetical protein